MPRNAPIAKETGDLRANCQRLGMNTIRVEFEELGFRAMHPLRSRMIEKRFESPRQSERGRK